MDKLVSILSEHNVDYEIIQHTAQINTAQEGAEYFGIEIGQTAPTLILKTEKGFFGLIISGDYGRVDFEILREKLLVDQIKLASPKEVEQVTGSKIGSVSLINFELPIIIDSQLNRFEYVYGGTGKPQTSLKIKPYDLEKINKIVGYIR
ncbi:aminoacyl-tRNA deacylase [Paenibacillus sp. 1-18]|uniref:aminoacyl-tRNA deacylase n=1 Tax=Paenibacillus sp. 1-18 TaxID=1333846 RepID=UPI00047133D0|nr:YbaK/EbsC family protein [Paenibacillus sp. 1-18]